jgi:hypothetical protein
MTSTAHALRILIVSAVAATLALTGCSAPSPDGGTTEPGSGATTEPAPAEGSGLDLPAQTLGGEADCSLFSPTELEAIWGIAFIDTDLGTVIEGGGDGGILYDCDYNTDDGLGLSVGFTFREHATEEGALQDMTDRRGASDFDGDAGIEHEDVAGIGDDAFIDFDADTIGTTSYASESLYVRVGTLVLQINATDLSGIKPEYREALKQTALLKL